MAESIFWVFHLPAYNPDGLVTFFQSGTLLTLEDSLSQGKPVPRDSKQLAFKCAFQMQTNQSRAHAPITSFIGLSCCVFLSYYPSHPRVRYQTTREASMPQSLLKLLTLVNLEPV